VAEVADAEIDLRALADPERELRIDRPAMQEVVGAEAPRILAHREQPERARCTDRAAEIRRAAQMLPGTRLDRDLADLPALGRLRDQVDEATRAAAPDQQRRRSLQDID